MASFKTTTDLFFPISAFAVCKTQMWASMPARIQERIGSDNKCCFSSLFPRQEKVVFEKYR